MGALRSLWLVRAQLELLSWQQVLEVTDVASISVRQLASKKAELQKCSNYAYSEVAVLPPACASHRGRPECSTAITAASPALPSPPSPACTRGRTTDLPPALLHATLSADRRLVALPWRSGGRDEENSGGTQAGPAARQAEDAHDAAEAVGTALVVDGWRTFRLGRQADEVPAECARPGDRRRA